MKEYYIVEAKRKKNTRKWQLFYINHLFSHPKKGGEVGGFILAKQKFGTKNL